MIKLVYEEIDTAITVLSEWLGPPTTTITGRPIGIGQLSKAKWLGPGWMIHTDHFRTHGSSMVVRGFLSFENDQLSTMWRLKYPNIGR